MELPSEIWDVIVNNSLKSNEDIIENMTMTEMNDLEVLLAQKKKDYFDCIKKKLDKYDVLGIYDKHNNWVMDCLLLNKQIKRNCCIRVAQLMGGAYKTLFGYYDAGEMGFTDVCLANCSFKIKSKWEHRNRENINIGFTLNVGDVFSFNLYTGYEWVKHRRRYEEMELFKDGLEYGIVIAITKYKIAIINHSNNLEYIDKNKVIKKINFDSNCFLDRKRYMTTYFRQMHPSIVLINGIKDYKKTLKVVNIGELIKIQRKFGKLGKIM